MTNMEDNERKELELSEKTLEDVTYETSLNRTLNRTLLGEIEYMTLHTLDMGVRKIEYVAKTAGNYVFGQDAMERLIKLERGTERAFKLGLVGMIMLCGGIYWEFAKVESNYDKSRASHVHKQKTITQYKDTLHKTK